MKKADKEKLNSERINKISIAKIDPELEKTFLSGGEGLRNLSKK